MIWASSQSALQYVVKPTPVISGLAEQGTDVRTEFIVGVTTFLATVHIAFVNPIILGKTGMDQGAVFASQPPSALWSWPDVRDYNAADYSTGIGLGFITYALAKIISGKVREASPAVIVLAVLFATKFAVTG
jgi:AGZA family xanthine/uracil permease-like MFS transporter